MNIQATEIPVDKKTMKAEIDATNRKVIYIIDDGGKVFAIPLAPFGVLEVPTQNYNVGNLAYRITLKRN